jgi:hypothetical protein
MVYAYFAAFVFIFFSLHFVGTRHTGKSYFWDFRRDRLPTNSAAVWAAVGAVGGPLLWMLQRFAPESLDWILGSDDPVARTVLGFALALIFITPFAWRWMLPFWGVVIAVTVYLHFSRSKDSL